MNDHIAIQILHRVAHAAGPVIVPKCLTSIGAAGLFAANNNLWLDIFRDAYTFSRWEHPGMFPVRRPDRGVMSSLTYTEL